jgi:hypothetical protein
MMLFTKIWVSNPEAKQQNNLIKRHIKEVSQKKTIENRKCYNP